MHHYCLVVFIVFKIATVEGNVNDVRIDVIPTQPKFMASENVEVTLRYTNFGLDIILIPRWAVPIETLNDQIFEITRNGVPVAYVGPLHRRRPLTPADRIALAPGKNLSSIVKVSPVYAMTRSGNYVIQIEVSIYNMLISVASSDTNSTQPPGHIQRAMRKTTSATCFVEGRKNSLLEPDEADAQFEKGRRLSFSGCSAKEIARTATAVDWAIEYSKETFLYLYGQKPSATPRYTTWFGRFSKAYWNTLTTKFRKIRNALAEKPLQFDCSCTDNTTYAYVYPIRPYKIFLCGAFWLTTTPLNDSMTGTLIHEVSHFRVVAYTKDYAYFMKECQQLALEYPAKARMNADSYTYFSENTPPLS